MSKTGWVSYGKPWQTFCYADKLAKAGVQIVVDGTTYLIGDINDLAGVCDDCRAFNSNAVVERWRRIVDEDVLK